MTDEAQVKQQSKKKKVEVEKSLNDVVVEASALDATTQVSDANLVDTNQDHKDQDQAVLSVETVEKAEVEIAKASEEVEHTALAQNELCVTNLLGRDALCITSSVVIPKYSKVVIEYKNASQKSLAIQNFEQINALHGRKQYAWED